MHLLYWICFPTGLKSHAVGALETCRPSTISQGSHGFGDAIIICGSPRLPGQDLSVSALWGEGGSVHWLLLLPTSSRQRPSPPSSWASKEPCKDEDIGSLPAWAGSRCSQELGGSAHHGSCTIHPSHSSLLPLANTGLFPIPPHTEKLPLCLKLLFGSEQTARGVKAPGKKSVSL